MSPAGWWRRRAARREAARARWERREAMAYTAEVILAAEPWAIDRAIAEMEAAELERQIADTE
jgi:hypothetical protein